MRWATNGIYGAPATGASCCLRSATDSWKQGAHGCTFVRSSYVDESRIRRDEGCSRLLEVVEARAIRQHHLRFGTLCVLGYVLLSWLVRFDMRLGHQIASLVYPLDTFSMYAGMPGTNQSALLVRDGDGNVHRVTAFRAFSCAEPLAGASAACAGQPISYLYEDLVRYIENHPGPGQRAVELIVRTWEIRTGAAPVSTPDCVIAHCRVSP